MAYTIYDDRTYTKYVPDNGRKWYRVRFNQNGKANFHISPQNSDLDVDIYVHDSESENSFEYGSSTNGRGKDDTIFEIPVLANKDYYVLLKHFSGPSGYVTLRVKNYPMFIGAANLQFESIEVPDQCIVGEEKRFRVYVENIGNRDSDKYYVKAYDAQGNHLDTDPEPPCDAGDVEYSPIDITINEAGSKDIIFKIVHNGNVEDIQTVVTTWKGQIKEIPYTVNHLPASCLARTGIDLDPSFLTIHSTANTAPAINERNWILNPDNPTPDVAFHIAVDEDGALEIFPLNELAYHAQSGSSVSIGIEMCEGGDRNKVLENTIHLVAKMLTERGWGVDKLRMHDDWYEKGCPGILQERRAENYHTWNWFKEEIHNLL